ncbi:MAG: hypothetical protein Q8941_06715 [Bacteroidota bacterium]|nr:hypothetical protein [Bacteroidota bacterium]
MKNLTALFILCFACFAARAQFVYKIKADSVKITRDSDTCNAELILENSTKNVKGFLYNKGNGRTEFRKALIQHDDSVWICGSDTLNLGSTSFFWRLKGNSGTNPSTNFLGTTDAQRLVFKTKNIERATIDTIGHVGIGTSSNNSHLLNVAMLEGTTDGRAIAKFTADDSWQTNLRMDNTTSNTSFTFLVGGSANTISNYGVGVKNFGIARSNIDGSNSTIPFILDSSGRLGLGSVIGGTDFLPKAALDVASSNSGILIPRLTTSQRNNITSGDLHNGLLLYNTDDNKFQFYNGTYWKSICDSCSVGTSWNLTGNSGINSSTNFLGTTDNHDIVFRTNNTERMRIRGIGSGLDGFVGIGTNNPASLLHLYGTNPAIYLEGDSNSYFPAVKFKTQPGNRTSFIDPYGIDPTFSGGLHIHTTTPFGSSAVGATNYGAKTTSTDSSVITHEIIAAKKQTADIFDVSEDISSLVGSMIPSPLFTVKNNGKLVLTKYKNSAGEDSVLSTDINGNVKLKSMGSSISSNAWSLAGNAGTSIATNFIGTTDNHAFIFKTNNTERMRIRGSDSGFDGFIGIGTNNPASLLHLFGPNPTMLIEGDSNSYFPAIKIKPRAPYRSGFIDPSGQVTTSYMGGLHISSTTTFGVSEVAATPTGNKSISSDSAIVIHEVIGTKNHAVDIFNVSKDTTTVPGVIMPGPLFTVKNTGKLAISKYKNNGSEDSVLSTDVNGNVKLKSLASSISSTAWSLTGNAGTSPSTNFLGTTDAQRLVFRTKNTEWVTIDTLGRVGIGTSTPSDLLTVLRAATGVTSDSKVINASTQGATFNTTSSVLTSYGGYFNSNGTRASGSNNLTNIGLFATASGAQVNYALKTDGNVNMTNLPSTTDTTTYKPVGINSSGDLAKVTGWPPAVNYTVQSLTESGSTITWNVANGINGAVTLTGTGRTLTITNPVAGQTYTIRIIQGTGGSKTVTTWPTNSKWPSGTTPTLSTAAGAYDIVVFYYDGTNYYGTYQQNFQ